MLTFLNGRRGRGCRELVEGGTRPRERDADSKLNTLCSVTVDFTERFRFSSRQNLIRALADFSTSPRHLTIAMKYKE
jgi:hypothetical protein